MLPEREYLEAIGRIAYRVSSLEWALLGDLSHLKGIPPDLTVARLAGQTTRGIADALRVAATQVADDRIRLWLEAGADVLRDAAEHRNHLLHARPATDPQGRQRLYRWRLQHTCGRPRTNAFFITDEWLADLEALLIEGGRRLTALRVFKP